MMGEDMDDYSTGNNLRQASDGKAIEIYVAESAQMRQYPPAQVQNPFSLFYVKQYVHVDNSAQLPISRTALSRVFIICKSGTEPTSHTLVKLALSCHKRVYSFTLSHIA
jgi:hypothetical protein